MVLEQLSQELAATVETVGESTVRVEGRRRLPATGVLWNGDGVIVTSHHVVERKDNIHVGLPNGETVDAQLVGRDPSTDLAVLRVNASGLQAANWASADEVKVGHLVLALGRPGENMQATLGVISAIEGRWRTRAGGDMDTYLQTDVVMYPGFSGGPLVGADNKVIGINSSALARGASITIPAATVDRVVRVLLEHGQVQRGYLGVGTQPVRLPTANAEKLGQETGLLVVSVEPDSPADQGGLLIGDILVHFSGEKLSDVDTLLALLSGDTVGKSIPVKIVRGGQVQDIKVTVGIRPQG
ncbi:MAG: trypsin-like peptidase domain-containing protein [Anaerolineae bacterium]|nr:trypsin-like peptidase domain-containing protein [Anaerolineae bacterium]